MIENITSDIKKSTKEITYQRARAALPTLVRQVLVAQVMVGKDMTITYDKGTMIYEKTTMTYKELGKEIDAHHRPVLHVLYCIERLLKKLGEHWKEEIPAIQGIVVNQDTRLPGNRVEFLRDQKLDTRSEAKLVMENFTEVIKYQKWEAVLEELGLSMPQKIIHKRLQAAVQRPSTHESLAHKQLKIYVAHNPQCVDVEKSLAPGKIEHRLLSGDIPDVLFENKRHCIAVEVKSHISDDNDILRGLFQCVKYRAILEAYQSLGIAKYQVVDARLAIERTLPKDLIWVKKVLDVKVFENIQISNV